MNISRFLLGTLVVVFFFFFFLKQHEMGIFILVIKFNMDALIFVLFFIQSHLIIVCLKS